MKKENTLLCGIILFFVFARQVESFAVCNNRMLSTNKNNGSITVSSILLDPNVIATPDKAVLNTKEQNLGQGHFEAGGWVAGVQDTKQYLQIQLSSPSVIRGLVTQGRNGCCQQWVSEYKVSYSQDCKTWTDVQKTFTGNSDQDTPIENLFPCPVSAKCIRITPLKWNDKISMRVDVLGCPIIPISTLHLTTKPLALSTTTPKSTLGVANISSTIAMTQTASGLTTSVYTSPSTISTPTSTITSGPTTTNGCTDASGIDCQLLQTQVKICNNPIASSKYCQKFCGLCGATKTTHIATTNTPVASTSESSTSSQAFVSSNEPSTSSTHIFTSSSESSTMTSSQITTFVPTSLSNVHQTGSPQITKDQTSTPQMSPTHSSINNSQQITTVQGGSSSTSVSTAPNTQPTSQQCKDNPGIDCDLLNTTVGICSNLLTAQLYCPSFCNLCGVNTSTATSISQSFQSNHTTETSVIPTTTTACQDRKGVDCSLLQKFYKVCQDKTSASTYCPKYCGFCSSTTSAGQTTSLKIKNSSTNKSSPPTPILTNMTVNLASTSQDASSTAKSIQTKSATTLPTSIVFSSTSTSQRSSTQKSSSLTSGSPFGASNAARSQASSSSTTQTPTSCTDKVGVDCKMLDTHLNLCTDRKSALMYCPLYCGICGTSIGLTSPFGTTNTAIPTNRKPVSGVSKPQTTISSSVAQTSGHQTKLQTTGHSLVTKIDTTQPNSTISRKVSTLSTSTVNSTVTTATSMSSSPLTTSTTMTTARNGCKDSQGVDCLVLNQYWNICSNRVAALASCPLFCGLCGSSTQARQTSRVMTTTHSQFTSGNPSNGTQTLLNTTQPLPTTVQSKSIALSSSTYSKTTLTMQSISGSTSQTPKSVVSTNQMAQFSTGNYCKDKTGIDCHQLDVYLGICSDLKSAQLYCPLYCGVCGSTSASSSHQTALPKLTTVNQTNNNLLSVTKSSLSTSQPMFTHTSATNSLSGRSSIASTPFTTKSQSNTSTNGIQTNVVTGNSTQQSTMFPLGYSTKLGHNQASTVSSFSNTLSTSSPFLISNISSSVMTPTSSISGLPKSSTGSAGSSMAASCADKIGVDCKQLNKYLNICQDRVTSMAYCSNYCGLCAQMSVTNTTRISTNTGQSTTAKTNNIFTKSNQHSSYKSTLFTTSSSSNANAYTISSGKKTLNINTTLSSFTRTSTLAISTTSKPSASGQTTYNSPTRYISTNGPFFSTSIGFISGQTSNISHSTGLALTSGGSFSSSVISTSLNFTPGQTNTTNVPASPILTNDQTSSKTFTSTSPAITSSQTSSGTSNLNSTYGQTFSNGLTPTFSSVISGKVSSGTPSAGLTSTSGQKVSNDLTSTSPIYTSGPTISDTSSAALISTSSQTFSKTMTFTPPILTSGQKTSVTSSSGLSSTSGQSISNRLTYTSSSVTSGLTRSNNSSTGSTLSSGQTFSETLSSTSANVTTFGRTNSGTSSTGPTSPYGQTVSNILTSTSSLITSGKTGSITSSAGFTSDYGQVFSNSLTPTSAVLTSGQRSSVTSSAGLSSTSSQTLSNFFTSTSPNSRSRPTIYWTSSPSLILISSQTSSKTMTSTPPIITFGQASSGISSSSPNFTSAQTFSETLKSTSPVINTGPTSSEQRSSVTFSQGLTSTFGKTFSNTLTSTASTVTSGPKGSGLPSAGLTLTYGQTFSNLSTSLTPMITSGQTSPGTSRAAIISANGLTFSKSLTSSILTYGQTSSGNAIAGVTSASGQPLANTFTSISQNLTSGQTSPVTINTASPSTSGHTFSNSLTTTSKSLDPGQTSSGTATADSNSTYGPTFSKTFTSTSSSSTSGLTRSGASRASLTSTSGQTFSNTFTSTSPELTSGLISSSASSGSLTSTSVQTFSNTFTPSSQSFGSSSPSSISTSAQTFSNDLTSASLGFTSSSKSYGTHIASLSSTTDQTFSNTLTTTPPNFTSEQTRSYTSSSSLTSTSGGTFSNALKSTTPGLTSGQTNHGTSTGQPLLSGHTIYNTSPSLTSEQTDSGSSSAGRKSYSFSTTVATLGSSQTLSRSFTPSSLVFTSGHTNTAGVAQTAVISGQTTMKTSPSITFTASPSSISSNKPASVSARQGTTQRNSGFASKATIYSLSGYSGPTSPELTTSASLTNTSKTTIVSSSIGTTNSPSAKSETTSTVSSFLNSTMVSSSNSPQTSVPFSYMSTTPDPCNDTLDCPLVDRFWGVCQKMATAKGCLSYCGFCPSGMPVTQKQADSSTSQGPGNSVGRTTGLSSMVTANSISISTPFLKSSVPSSSATASSRRNTTFPHIVTQTNTAMTTQSPGTSSPTVQSISNGQTGTPGGTSQPSTVLAFASSVNASGIQKSTQNLPGSIISSKLTTITQSSKPGPSFTGSVGPTLSYASTVTTSQPTTATFLTTTRDPCNDTLDCQLLDKFWGICGNISTAKGCLSYCGFCPSGVPSYQGSKIHSSSSLLPLSTSQLSPSSSSASMISSGATLASAIASYPSVTFQSYGTSTDSVSGSKAYLVSINTTPGGLAGTSTLSCRDSPTVDCALIDKFWHICSDIKTAQSCLRHCGFCP